MSERSAAVEPLNYACSALHHFEIVVSAMFMLKCDQVLLW